jgi:hypothetical protein
MMPYDEGDVYCRWGDPLPLESDHRVSRNCVVTSAIRSDNGSIQPDHCGRMLILDYDHTTGMLTFVHLDTPSISTTWVKGPGWVRVFTRVLRDMDHRDYYDGERHGAFKRCEEDDT